MTHGSTPLTGKQLPAPVHLIRDGVSFETCEGDVEAFKTLLTQTMAARDLRF